MSNAELLDELLVRWEDEHDQGRDLTPEELCRDAPHLVHRAAEEIAKLQQFRSTPTFETTPIPPPPSPPMGAPPPPVKAFAGLRYEPRRHHASGGLGHVFVAVDREVGREVALKRIKPEFADKPGDRARFEREAEITGRLEHPGVVPLYGRGRDADGRPYYAMRFIRGRSLRGAIEEFYAPDKAKRNSGGRVVAFRGLLQSFVGACNTVAYAHSRGVIHRDLKPDNIMLGPYGETLVVDWGLAKYVGRDEPARDLAEESVRPAALPDGEDTRTGATVGTPAFISPEQALGRKDVGSASDVFSLGTTLYQLLTGRPPYQGWQALVDAAAGTFPRPRHVRRDAPPALEAVCLKAMAFRLEERYATAQELARDVDRWLADEPTAAYREPWRVRARRWVKRHRTPVTATAAALLVGALLVGGGLWWKADQEGRAAKERERQEKAAARQADEMERDVQAALAETSRLEGEGQWEAAQAAAARAVGRLAGGGPEELRRRVAQTQGDLNLQARLEALAVEVVEPRPKIDRAGTLWVGVAGARDPAQIDRDYAAILRDDGAPLDATDPEQMAAWVRASAIREQLIQALDSWAYLKRDAKIEGAERLREAAQRADGNDWRRRLRDLSARGDRAALEQLAGQNDVLEQPPPALADLGRSLSQVGSTAVAVETLRKTQRRYPGDLGINVLLASVLSGTAPSGEEAVGFYRAALAIRPLNQFLHNSLGNVLNDQGKMSEAAAEYQRAIDLDPKNAFAHNNLGNVLDKQGKPDAAAAEYRRAIDLDPKYTVAHTNLGSVLAKQGKPDEAAAEFRRAIDLDPNYAPAYINLGVVLDDQGKPDAAMAEYQRAIDVDPKFAPAHVNLGNVLDKQGKPDAAAAEYRRAIDLDPEYALAHNNLGNVLAKQGKPDEAAAVRRAIDLDPKYAPAHISLGVVLDDQGKLDEAAAEYRRAIDLDPKLAVAHVNLGNTLDKQGYADAAVTEFRRAIDLDPKLAVAHANLGNVLAEQGKLDEAAAEYQRGIDLDPKYARAHFGLGLLRAKQGKLDEAAVEYRRAIDLDPRDARAHNNLGNVLLKQQGKLDEAAVEYRRATDLDPKEALYQHNLGLMLGQQGKFEESIASLQRALELLPPGDRGRPSYQRDVSQAKRLLELDQKLSAVLKGERQIRDPAEGVELARLCQEFKRCNVASARFYTEAFAQQPALADDLATANRYNAACVASLAAAGKGADAGLDGEERTRLRGQALDWLRTDLTAWDQRRQDDPKAGPEIQKTLQDWQKDAGLAGVRDADALAKLPEPERAAWRKLWTDVDALLAKVDPSTKP